MTNTTDTFWSVDGVSLQTYAYNIETTGVDRMGVPSLRGDDVTIPFAPGDLWRPKVPDSRTIYLSMWVVGANTDGTLPGGSSSRKKFEENWYTLRNLLWTPNREITLTKRFRPLGSTTVVTASAKAQFIGGLSPDMSGTQRARFVAQLKLADPFFYGAEETINLNNHNVQTPVDVKGDYDTHKINVTFSPSMTTALIRNQTGSGADMLTQTLSIQGRSVTTAVNIDVAQFYASQGSINVSGFIHSTSSPYWLTLKPGVNTLRLTKGSNSESGYAIIKYLPAYL